MFTYILLVLRTINFGAVISRLNVLEYFGQLEILTFKPTSYILFKCIYFVISI